MKLLPHWIVGNRFATFQDAESLTAIQMVSRLHGTVNELIKEHNDFIDSINKQITEFMEGSQSDFETFAVGLRQEFQDFIDTVNLKYLNSESTYQNFVVDVDNRILEQNKTIENAVNYMVTNMNEVLIDLVSKAIQDGTIHVATNYDAENEALTIILS